MIPLARPYFDEEELKEIKRALDTGWVDGYGPIATEFREKLSNYLNSNVVLTSNGTTALHLAMRGLNIQKGDDVLVADFTFPATGHAVLYCNANPVFVDVDLDTYNIDPNLIEDKITKNTKAIIPVHIAGNPCDMTSILKIAKKNNIKVVEDAACSLGAKWDNKLSGTMGDIGCFSFHAIKNMTTGQGGAVISKNKDIAEKMKFLSHFGMTPSNVREQSEEVILPEFTELGYNYLLSDILAAVGIAQLKKLEMMNKKRKELANYYTEKLSKIDMIKTPYKDKKAEHVYQNYVIVLDKKINRNKVIYLTRKEGIQTQIGKYASHVQPVYRSKDKCPNSLFLQNQTLALPIYHTLTEKDIDFVVDKLKNIINKIK